MAARVRLTAENFPPPGRLIDLGDGCRLHVHVSGSGSSAIVLEAGIAATSLSWALVEPHLCRMGTVVSYDRAGLGWSGPAVSPRKPSVIAGELRRALEVVGVPGPYVLVGHSFGGLVVQRFAVDYPDLVRALLLLDPLSAHEWHPLSAAGAKRLAMGVMLSRRGGVLARLGVVGGALGFLLSGNRLVPKLAARFGGGPGGVKVTNRLVGEVRKLPREVWPAIAYHWSQAKNFEGMAQHLESLPESSVEMQGVALDPRIPVTMILAESAPAPAGLPTHWKVIKAENSGHWVQLDRPDLVISEARALR